MSIEEESSEVPVVKLAEVKPFQNRFKTVFKVLEKSEEKEVANRTNPDETHRMCDVTVADDTASIILTAWDDDINLLEEGNYFSLTNGYVNLFKSSMRLSISFCLVPFKTSSTTCSKNPLNTCGKFDFLYSKPFTSKDSLEIPSCFVIH